MTFDRFVAVDWTGAVGERHAAIAVAECFAGDAAPRLVEPGHRWSRGEVAALIGGIAARGERTLIGMDFSFSLPFGDADSYFPGNTGPSDARTLWSEVSAICAADGHHAAHAYIAHRRDHFWLGKADGPRAPKARLRAVEHADRARGGMPSSCFVLLGAAQCGKASLSGMRLLNDAPLPVWPFDPPPATGPVLVEIYCRIFAAAGGVRGKIRDRAILDAALAKLSSAAAAMPDRFTDHIGDALISAAGMRAFAGQPRYWRPPEMSDAIARTEGWTFGVV